MSEAEKLIIGIIISWVGGVGLVILAELVF